MVAPRADTLFEISWEACNKVGGIYTVIQTKLHEMQRLYPGYVLIGPDLGSREFEERKPPKKWKEVFNALAAEGIRCKYGVWLIPGEPTVVLIRSSMKDKDQHKAWLWKEFQIDSMHASYEFEEPLCFAVAAGKLIEQYAAKSKKRTVAHCHEWMTGFAALHLKHVPNVATVFTTHATMLGRTIAGNGHELYDIIDTINPEEWAYKFNVQDKHLAEKACAHHADTFTTVSEITGLEAEKLLGKKPDVLVYNGFNTERFPTFEETSLRHIKSKDMLKEFLAYMFFPYYTFDLDNTLMFFTSGRYEFRNKGIDILIDAIGTLNEELKGKNVPTVVMFFCVIMGKGGVRHDVLENKNYYQHVRSTVDWHKKHLLQHLTLGLVSGKRDGTLVNDVLEKINENVSHFSREGLPPVATHDIPNAEDDPMLQSFHAHGLQNAQDDPVKVIIYPGYFDGSDGVLNLDYYDATVGMNLGIFPSAYEPWGYTPLESAVLGIPTITTDLAGFGRYVTCKEREGVTVLQREGTSREEVVTALKEELKAFILADRNERVKKGFMAKSLADTCNWKTFITRYVEAHNLALERL
ncbi:MAG: glycogen/starch synthase [Candidatus Woesearchaeota archaeon]|nr:glycogen/starch synthase [Candidatus Woesearchaeota archaeon]